MKKIFTSLPFKLLVGVVIGIIAGQFAGFESAGAVGDAVMNVVVTVRFILSELINFCVPADHYRIYRAVDHKARKKCVPDAWGGAVLRLYVVYSGGASVHGCRIRDHSQAVHRFLRWKD